MSFAAIAYKAALRGEQVMVGERFFASRKTCSVWGHKLETPPLSVRAWTCPVWGRPQDCDLNAVRNIAVRRGCLKRLCGRLRREAWGEEGAGCGFGYGETGLDEAGGRLSK